MTMTMTMGGPAMTCQPAREGMVGREGGREGNCGESGPWCVSRSFGDRWPAGRPHPDLARRAADMRPSPGLGSRDAL